MSGGRQVGICLLCSRSNCFIDTDGKSEIIIICEEEDEGVGEFLGEVKVPSNATDKGNDNCVQLKKQILTLFALRNILDVPVSWWEKRLGKIEGRLSSSCVQICNDCLSTAVVKAWQIHEKMVALEKEFAEVKEEIRETMKERMERMMKRRKKEGKGNKSKMSGGAAAYRILDEIVKRTFSQTETDICQITTTATINAQGKQIQKTDIHEANQKMEPNEDGGGDSVDVGCDDDTFDDDNGFEPYHSGGGEDNDDEFEPEPNDDDDEINASSSDDEYEPSPSKKRKIKGKPSPNTVKMKPRKRAPRIRKPNSSANSYRCTRCNSRFKISEEYEAHMKAHEENDAEGESAFNCPQCQFPARSSLELDVHIHNRHVIPNRLRTYECPLCTYKSKIWRHLKAHADSEHPTATEEELGPEIHLRCPVCGLQLPSLRAYHFHEQNAHPAVPSSSDPPEGDHGPVQCSDCGVLFESQYKLRFHIMATHKRVDKVVCEICGKGFTRQKYLDSHKISHDRHHQREYVCHLCGADYAYQFTLNDHYKKHHAITSDDKSNASNDQIFKCRYCDLTSPFSVVITRHLKIHKEESGHRCEKCGKCYMTSQGLRRHLIINHPENSDEKFKCPHCYKEYSSQDSVQSHVRHHCRIKKRMDQQSLLELPVPTQPQPENPAPVNDNIDMIMLKFESDT